MTTTEDSTLMQRGIALLEANRPESLVEALACFDAAIDLRRRAFSPGDPHAAFLLAASFMNRGDALTRLREPARLADAVRSYDEALTILRDAPPDADPLYRRRHAIAWMNRGLTLQEQRSEPSLHAAVESFEHAIVLTRGHPAHALLLASTLLNHAKALVTILPPRAAEAFQSAAHALENVRDTAALDPLAAEIHLKAQVILCRAAETLLGTGPDPATSQELLCAATDGVETGLGLARQWEARADSFLGPLATILFRFGIDLYRRRQPQFLGEFIRENLETSGEVEWHLLAANTLAEETLAAGGESFAYLGTPRQKFVAENIRTLQFSREKLHGLLKAKPSESD